MAHTACITPGCHDEDAHDIDQTTGLCGACSRSATPNVCTCGLPLSKNPHPNAGDPKHLLTVGAMWVCIPCTVRSRHDAQVCAEGFETFAASYDAEVREVVEVLCAAGYAYAGKDPAAAVRDLIARLPDLP